MHDESAPAPEQHPRVILTTPRLILRTATDQDIARMHERVLGDAEVMRYVFQGVPMTLERTEAVMRKFFTFGESLTGIAVLAEKPAAELIGFAGVFPTEALGADDFEIGFVLARHAWGRGIATEIGEAQLAFGFEQLNCPRLLGLVDPHNEPSIHALKKLGLHYLKDVREPGRANRSVFCIEIEEWRARSVEQRA
ncbi:MAG TPA: GNAT family N-acetyltransferase [Bradyrhizobium sp.]|nr:GNAT family N-acetyltransferase [Bradyrhizobium sp.]